MEWYHNFHRVCREAPTRLRSCQGIADFNRKVFHAAEREKPSCDNATDCSQHQAAILSSSASLNKGVYCRGGDGIPGLRYRRFERGACTTEALT